jgi:hypothetical protein
VLEKGHVLQGLCLELHFLYVWTLGEAWLQVTSDTQTGGARREEQPQNPDCRNKTAATRLPQVALALSLRICASTVRNETLEVADGKTWFGMLPELLGNNLG